MVERATTKSTQGAEFLKRINVKSFLLTDYPFARPKIYSRLLSESFIKLALVSNTTGATPCFRVTS